MELISKQSESDLCKGHRPRKSTQWHGMGQAKKNKNQWAWPSWSKTVDWEFKTSQTKVHLTSTLEHKYVDDSLTGFIRH